MVKKRLRGDYHDAVEELVGAITEKYGNRLRAIYAGGSFAREDFVPGRSDIDLYIVAENDKEDLQKELHAEALKIERKRFPDLLRVFDKFVGVSVTTVKEIEEGRSFLGMGFEYSNFIREGRLLWGEDIKALIPEPAPEKQQDSAKNHLGRTYEMVSNLEKYFKWLMWIPFRLVPRAKKQHWTRQAFNLTFRAGALFLGSQGVYVSKKEDIALAFNQQVEEEELRTMMSYAVSLWDKWKNEPLNDEETKRLLRDSLHIVKGLERLSNGVRTTT